MYVMAASLGNDMREIENTKADLSLLAMKAFQEICSLRSVNDWASNCVGELANGRPPGPKMTAVSVVVTYCRRISSSEVMILTVRIWG
jgi:hypothetical protein